MMYELKRIHGKKGSLFGEIVLDLWNYEYNVGYEIKVTVWKYMIYIDKHIEYLRGLVGPLSYSAIEAYLSVTYICATHVSINSLSMKYGDIRLFSIQNPIAASS